MNKERLKKLKNLLDDFLWDYSEEMRYDQITNARELMKIIEEYVKL